MRTHIAAAALLVAVATLTACSTTEPTVNTKPAKKSAPAKDAAKPKASPTEQAGVGDTLTLHGMDDGSQLDVTLVKWVDNAKSADEFTSPEKGNKWVAAQFKIVNTGTAVYSDSPSNGAQVADEQGQQFNPTFATITAGPEMQAGVRLAKGATALGYITFEVPKTSKIATLQLALDSGFADESGQWQIAK